MTISCSAEELRTRVYKKIALLALCQSKHIAPGHTESHLLSMRVCHSAVHVLKARGDIITGLGANKRAAIDYQCAEVCPAGCCSFGYGIFQKLKVPQVLTSPCHLRRNSLYSMTCLINASQLHCRLFSRHLIKKHHWFRGFQVVS